jgi:hypothetical protein
VTLSATPTLPDIQATPKPAAEPTKTPHDDFDPKALTVMLPQSESDLRVQVTLEGVSE